MLKTALNKNIIHHTWKLANIVPIPKPNKDTDKSTSYRPISLPSVIAKTILTKQQTKQQTSHYTATIYQGNASNQKQLHTCHRRTDPEPTIFYQRLNLVQSPICTCGTENQTTEHILQKCPAYQHLRQQIWSDGTSLHQKLYGKKEELERTVGFIQQDGLSVQSSEREEKEERKLFYICS